MDAAADGGGRMFAGSDYREDEKWLTSWKGEGRVRRSAGGGGQGLDDRKK
jgi:hypothetical protein